MTLFTCTAVRAKLPAFHDRELPVSELIEMESHVKTCAACSAELRDLAEVGAALRLVSAPGPADDWTGVQPGVISRMRAEAHESWAAKTGRCFDDLHLVWIGFAATAATVICSAVALSALHFAPERRIDSLAAAMAGMAARASAPVGSDLNPVRIDERLGPRYSPLVDYIRVPSVPLEGPMEAMLLTPVSEEELMLAFSAVVTREGRFDRLSVLTSDTDHRQELEVILDGMSRARVEPARVGDDPIAVNLVWLHTHTTVKAKAPRTT